MRAVSRPPLHLAPRRYRSAGPTCSPRRPRSAKSTLWAIIVQYAGRRWSFDARYSAQVFVYGSDVMLGHVLKGRPGHDLQKIAIEGRWKAVGGHGRRTRRM